MAAGMGDQKFFHRQTWVDAGGCASPLATSSRLFAATPATLERTLYALEADLGSSGSVKRPKLAPISAARFV
jgi:hypothetical protein